MAKFAALILVMSLIEGFTPCNDLPEIQWEKPRRNRREVSFWKKARPSLPKLAKPRQTGRGALWKTKCPPCSWMKNMLSKITSRYTAKNLAGHYEYPRFPQNHAPSKLGQFSRQEVVRDRGCCSSGTWNNWATAVTPESWPSNRRTASDRAVALYKNLWYLMGRAFQTFSMHFQSPPFGRMSL